MPICYDIDIDIIGVDESGEEYETVLPRRERSQDQITPEQLGERVRSFWEDFISTLGDTAPDRASRYRWPGGYRITAIYQC